MIVAFQCMKYHDREKVWPADVCIVNHEKKETYQEGLLVAKWAQTKTTTKTEPSSCFYIGTSYSNCLSGRDLH